MRKRSSRCIFMVHVALYDNITDEAQPTKAAAISQLTTRHTLQLDPFQAYFKMINGYKQTAIVKGALIDASI